MKPMSKIETKNKYQKALEMILKQKYEDFSEFMLCMATLQELIILSVEAGVIENE